jgi:hypothetical protein
LTPVADGRILWRQINKTGGGQSMAVSGQGPDRTDVAAAAGQALRPVRKAAAAHDPLILIVEILIYVPSIANFRSTGSTTGWRRRIPRRWCWMQLRAAWFRMRWRGRFWPASGRGRWRSRPAAAPAAGGGRHAEKIDHDIDMRDVSAWSAIVDAFQIMLDSGDEVMRILGPAPGSGQFIEVVADEKPLRTRCSVSRATCCCCRW